jgi:hypothetical protein
MSVEKECLIEKAFKSASINFDSKPSPTGDVDTLEFDSQLIKHDQYFTYSVAVRNLIQVDNAHNIGFKPNQLKMICGQCRNCQSDIRYTDNYSTQITRTNLYALESPIDMDLFTAKMYHPTQSGVFDGKRMCLIDDEDTIFQYFFIEMGAEVLNILIHHVQPIGQQIESLQDRILAFIPDIAIVDVGLGFVDGLKIIDFIRQSGVIVIALTGIEQNDEIGTRPHVLLTKPVGADAFIDILDKTFTLREQGKL